MFISVMRFHKMLYISGTIRILLHILFFEVYFLKNMSNLNGHINPLLDNDSESVLADDEGSDIGHAHIDSPDAESVPEITVGVSPASSSDITVSSLSLLSTEHSTTDETSTQNQDMSGVPDISRQKNISEKGAVQTISSDTEILFRPLKVKEEKHPVPNIPSTSKKRALECSPSFLDHNVSDMATISSEESFKKFKVDDNLEEISSKISSDSSHTSFPSKHLEKEDKASPTAPIEETDANIYLKSEDKVKDQGNQKSVESCFTSYNKGKHPGEKSIKIDLRDAGSPTKSSSHSEQSSPELSSIDAETTHKDTEVKLIDTSKSTTEINLVKLDSKDRLDVSRLSTQISSIEESAEVDTTTIRKGEKRKMSSPETIDHKMKKQKPATSMEFLNISDKGDCKGTGNISPCSNLTSEVKTKTYVDVQDLRRQNILQESENLTILNISDSGNLKEPDESLHTTIAESSEISGNSTGEGSTSGSTSTSEEQVKIDVGKLSPVILDEDALLSAPGKSDNFTKSQTTNKSKEETLLKEVKLNISDSIKDKDDSQTIETFKQSAEFSKQVERQTSENESTDTEHSIIKQESESASSASYDQEMLKQTGESSIESRELSIRIARRTESPVLIEENAMISPPDRMRETSMDFSELCETESSKPTLYVELIDATKIFQQHKLRNIPSDRRSEFTGKPSDLPELNKKSTEETSTPSGNIMETESGESLKMVGTSSQISSVSNISINEQDQTQSSLIKFLSENFPHTYEMTPSGSLIPVGETAIASGIRIEKIGITNDPLSSEQGSKVEYVPEAEKTPNLECEKIPGFSSEIVSKVKDEVRPVVKQKFSKLEGSEQKEATLTNRLILAGEERKIPVEDEKSEQSSLEEDSSISEQKKQDLLREKFE